VPVGRVGMRVTAGCLVGEPSTGCAVGSPALTLGIIVGLLLGGVPTLGSTVGLRVGAGAVGIGVGAVGTAVGA
jgi:hypothetical protein